MLTIKCPKCATLMKLEQQAVAVKVKCPKCQTVLKVPGKEPAPKPSEQAATPTAKQPARKQPAREQPARQQPARQKSARQQPAAQAAAKRKPAAKKVTTPAPAESPFADDNPFENLPSGGFDTADAATAGADPFAADPFAEAPAAGGSSSGGFDFGNLDLPAAAPAAGGFPAAGVPAAGGNAFPAATGPLAGPLAAAAPAAAPSATKPSAGSSGAGPKRPINKKLLWIGIGSGAVVVLGLVIGLVVMAVQSKGSKQARSSGASSSGAVQVPAGFQAGSVSGVSFVVPEGKSVERPPTSIEAQVFESSATGATFFVGIDTYEFLNPSQMQLSLRAGRMIMSDVYGGASVERDGHTGAKGSSSGGMTLTDMTVEYYLVGDQVILIGCGMPRVEWTEEDLEEGRPPEPSEEETAKREAFEGEKATFFESVRI
ncbi:hypothetical protein Enr13x_38200 [Stieleria neptunia]|uniref:Uncharacterized protein n=1 Tax=Stieleria neptunia TaxID=2527979 RepID=A0A518HSX9_9BACT|nr:hypothetical protein [Stieleria neptunia]QDV43959.1 hypothetical protein Enr13x_38200 [Stieleria neptunia]